MGGTSRTMATSSLTNNQNEMRVYKCLRPCPCVTVGKTKGGRNAKGYFGSSSCGVVAIVVVAIWSGDLEITRFIPAFGSCLELGAQKFTFKHAKGSTPSYYVRDSWSSRVCRQCAVDDTSINSNWCSDSKGDAEGNSMSIEIE